jgi:hypothetical protein
METTAKAISRATARQEMVVRLRSAMMNPAKAEILCADHLADVMRHPFPFQDFVYVLVAGDGLCERCIDLDRRPTPWNTHQQGLREGRANSTR